MKYITVLFAVFVVVIIVLADRGQLGPLHVIYDFPYGDKAGHVVVFATLNFLTTLTLIRALPKRDPKRVALAIGLILAALIGAEEYSQKNFPSRTFDLLDLTASYIGLVFGGWLALRHKKREPL
jgi:VanZ family protein